jgi:hypothetical protein
MQKMIEKEAYREHKDMGKLFKTHGLLYGRYNGQQ